MRMAHAVFGGAVVHIMGRVSVTRLLVITDEMKVSLDSAGDWRMAGIVCDRRSSRQAES